MNNEAILNKLVELGYVRELPHKPEQLVMHEWSEGVFPTRHFNPMLSQYNMLVQDALIAECAKRGLEIVIRNNELLICNIKYPIYDSGQYSRQAIIEAFCKVTGVECD